MYHTEPPTDKTIREWYMNSSRVAACALRNEQAAILLEFMYHSRIVLSVGGSVWYMIRNLRCIVTIHSVLANSKTQNAFSFTANSIFLHYYPLAVEPGSTPRSLVQNKTWRDSLPIDMLLSAVSVLVVAQLSSEIPEGLMNNPVFCAVLHCRMWPARPLHIFTHNLINDTIFGKKLLNMKCLF